MKLEDFLIKAKQNTYASSGEGGERILTDGAKELVYEEDKWKYRDLYFGFDPFIGEEIVYKDDKILWGMNYYGYTLESVDASLLYEFLKQAMLRVKPERPFRGPDNFKEGEWKYTDRSDGSINNFKGEEIIYYKGNKVYRLDYHGGMIKKK